MTVTAIVTSSADPIKSVSTSIVITTAASNLANGNLVFQLSAQAVPAGSFVTDVLVMNNEAMMGSEQDVANVTTDSNDDRPFNQFSKMTGGSYVTDPEGSLWISINVYQRGTETLNAFSLPQHEDPSLTSSAGE